MVHVIRGDATPLYLRRYGEILMATTKRKGIRRMLEREKTMVAQT
jgi:hypothetical protein